MRACRFHNTNSSVVSNPRVSASEVCTVKSTIKYNNNSRPCPQLLTREPLGSWDVVVLQDNSALPTVAAARHSMLHQSVREYAAALRSQAAAAGRNQSTILAAYMTWSYYAGMPACPSGKRGCFPLRSLRTLSSCNTSDVFLSKVSDSPCQGYALARAYAETLLHGADVVVPAGLAWQAARGSPEIPTACQAAIDAEYATAGILSKLDLPLRAADPLDARWKGPEEAKRLFRDKGSNYTSKYCGGDEGCHIDHHASIDSMYLNALVFFATLFRQSPVGAAVPDGKQSIDGMVLPAVSDLEEARAMQRIAHDIVLGNMDVWWGTDPQAPCSWSTTTDENNKFGCANGTRCSGRGCCVQGGGIAKCPPNRPLMCADRSCSGDLCCERDCAHLGGVRPCDVAFQANESDR